jgi:hypothetical protein
MYLFVALQSLSSFFFLRKSLTDRATGQARKEITGEVHMAAVKFWLPKGLCKDTVMGLEYLGTKDGVVDSHMKEAK